MLQTILIAEADEVLAQRIRHALEARGYRVFTAQDCSEAIAFVVSGRADLLVLDHALPNEGGLAVLQALRENASAKTLPIIMLACDMPTADVFRAWNLGVDSLQSKRPDHLFALTLELAAKIKRIFKSIDEDAGSSFHILLEGDSPTRGQA